MFSFLFDLVRPLALAIALAGCSAVFAAEPPRLILQITVDALRQDMVGQYLPRMGRGGFRYLQEKGVSYTNAHYEHANTETIVGHASLATGTTPAHHGMVANVWFDRGLGQPVYNIEDGRYQLLTHGADVDDASEIDPTQKAASVEGRSPRALLTSTFADELSAGTGGKAKVFAVSVKDRGAVPLAGQAGKAFWFSKQAGEFVSSSYYYQRYPEWVEQWNSAGKVKAYGKQSWQLSEAIENYEHRAADDQPWEVDFPGFGRSFPHPWGDASGKYFTTFLTLSPAGDQLTMDFARRLISEEEMGQDAISDYLAVSFSSTDYVNHIFGSASLEAEDNLLQLDRTLAELLAHVDKEVGLEHTLVVLSADHGTADVAEYLATLGNHNVDVFEVDSCIARIESALASEYPGSSESLLRHYLPPYIYLDLERFKAPAKAALALQKVAHYAGQCPGVQTAMPLRRGGNDDLKPELLYRRVSNNFHPDRSGDVHLVLASGVYINHMDGLTIAANHGSPWNYDTHVPVIFAGQGIKAETVSRGITPYDIAPTLSARAGVNSPSGAIGSPLKEVLD